MPADSIKNKNEAALPSMMGTSSPSNSISKLSRPKPAQAESKCSTVDTRTPSFCITDAKRVSHTARAVAGMTDCSGVSTRTNWIPELTGAGLIEIVTLRPECKPIPTVFTGIAIVRCFIISLWIQGGDYSFFNIEAASLTSNLPGASRSKVFTTPSSTIMA